MFNERVTPKDRNGIKGAIMRVFSRSELRRKIIDKAIIEHSDPNRPKVKKWCRCAVCKKPEAKSYMQVDHIVPKIPFDSSFEEMGCDKLIDKTWCSEDNLQIICPSCHHAKTLLERKQKNEYKKRIKNGK